MDDDMMDDDMMDDDMMDDDMMDDDMMDDDMMDDDMMDDDMMDDDMMDDDMMDDDYQVIFEVTFNALEADATTGTFSSSIDGEAATGTTSNSEATVGGKTLPALTMTLDSDDPEDDPISFAVLKKTDDLYVLIDADNGNIHLMSKSQDQLQEWVEKMHMAPHHGDDGDGGGHDGDDGDDGEHGGWRRLWWPRCR